MILGLDISTFCGAVFHSPTVEEFIVLHYRPEHPRFRRWHRYLSTLDALLDKHKPRYAVIEGYGFARTANILPLVELGSLIRNQLTLRGIPWIEVAPSSLKKFTTGKGNASKDEMVWAVNELWDIGTRDDNIADAYALSRLGRAFFDGEATSDRGQEVIDMLKGKSEVLHV